MLSNFSATASTLRGVVLNMFLNCSKSLFIFGVIGVTAFLEKKVSMIPDSPLMPPRSYASKKEINFSRVSFRVFPNMVSSLFLVVNNVLNGMLWRHTMCLWECVFSAMWGGIEAVIVLY